MASKSNKIKKSVFALSFEPLNSTIEINRYFVPISNYINFISKRRLTKFLVFHKSYLTSSILQNNNKKKTLKRIKPFTLK